jgi:hypothetical protein
MNTEYPSSLNLFVKEAHNYIASDPSHHLDWHIRERIYPALGPVDDPIVRSVRGWFAVLTAQRVLALYDPPIAEHLARRLLKATEDYLKRVGVEDTVRALEMRGYYVFPYWTPNIPDYPYQHYLAARAIRKAAHETLGYLVEPFKAVASLREKPVEEKTLSLRGRFSDLMHYSDTVGDCAGLASLAYSWIQGYEDEITLTPDKSLEFWSWWLDEALSAAWQNSKDE